MIAQKRNLKRETRFTLLRRDYTGNPRLEKKMPLRICRRPMAAVRPWYNNSIYKTGEIYEVYI